MTKTDPAVETRAIRMLAAGDEPKHVAQTTGLTLEQIRQLQRDYPGTRPATPTTTAPRNPGSCEHTVDLPTALLREHPANIRTTLGDPIELEQLAQSIRQQGVLQPIVVMQHDHKFIVLAGHRRLAAAEIAGLVRVPVTIRPAIDDNRAVEAMLVENLQRTALDPLDEAEAYRMLIAAGRSQAEIARAVGKPQGGISARLALLNLTSAEQDALRRKDITIRDAYEAGRDRSPKRQPHNDRRPKPKVVPHFHKNHPLAAAAGSSCTHETTLKLGVACGPCWETAIRADERANLTKEAVAS